MEQHRFSRFELLVGRDGLDRLAAASVAVFGLGGVGSFAVEALVRAGIGRLTLVDFDEVNITNVNRQIHAVEQTIGRPKVEVLAERCQQINPAAEIAVRRQYYLEESSEELLAPGFEYVLDCIDHITAKLHLIQSCRERNLPIIASMGAANKLDPTRVAVADLAATHRCRLARIIRKNLRRRGITEGIKVVYSTEDFRPLSAGRREAPERTGASYQDLRAPLGSSSYIPPIFGMTMAGEVIRALLEGNRP